MLKCVILLHILLAVIESGRFSVIRQGHVHAHMRSGTWYESPDADGGGLVGSVRCVSVREGASAELLEGSWAYGEGGADDIIVVRSTDPGDMEESLEWFPLLLSKAVVWADKHSSRMLTPHGVGNEIWLYIPRRERCHPSMRVTEAHSPTNVHSVSVIT